MERENNAFLLDLRHNNETLFKPAAAVSQLAASHASLDE